MGDLNQDLINDASTYKSAVPHPKKSLLFNINVPLKILTIPLQDYQTHFSTALNLNSYLKAEPTIKTHRFEKAKNHMADTVPPPTPDGDYHRQDEHIPGEFYTNCCLFYNSDSKSG